MLDKKRQSRQMVPSVSRLESLVLLMTLDTFSFTLTNAISAECDSDSHSIEVVDGAFVAPPTQK